MKNISSKSREHERNPLKETVERLWYCRRWKPNARSGHRVNPEEQNRTFTIFEFRGPIHSYCSSNSILPEVDLWIDAPTFF